MTWTDGLHKIVIEATDKKPQTVKDSVQFEIKKATAIEPPTEANGIKIYPNPTNDYINIGYKFDMPKNIQRRLYNLEGKLLYNDQKEVMGDQTDILDLTKYANGIYILRQTIGTDTKTSRMIKR